MTRRVGRPRVDLPTADHLAADLRIGTTVDTLARRHRCNPSTIRRRLIQDGYSTATGQPVNPTGPNLRYPNWTPRDWTVHALCLTYDPELFFADHPVDQARAKAVCRRCPVRHECLEDALTGRESGVWGGTTDRDRERLRR